ncbi:MAG TPA: acyl-CoA thioesterase [Usitatibacter sp.]|jgi:acyl-CoA thioesterase YciA|nr:acyl-CoA thioesterase [Usitatibacter sp.]
MTTPTTLPEGEQPVLRIVPMPADTNAHGTIFGGWVMAQVDIAGSVAAWDRAQGPIVTVAVNSFVFKEPVFVGDLVSFYARVLKVGRTSITVDVEVFAQRRRQTGTEAVKVTEAQLTYVAVDERRQRRLVPGATVEI